LESFANARNIPNDEKFDFYAKFLCFYYRYPHHCEFIIQTPLHIAVCCDLPDVVKILLESDEHLDLITDAWKYFELQDEMYNISDGLNSDFASYDLFFTEKNLFFELPFWEACKLGYENIVSEFIQWEDPFGYLELSYERALIYAVENDHKNIVEMILKSPISPGVNCRDGHLFTLAFDNSSMLNLLSKFDIRMHMSDNIIS